MQGTSVLIFLGIVLISAFVRAVSRAKGGQGTQYPGPVARGPVAQGPLARPWRPDGAPAVPPPWQPPQASPAEQPVQAPGPEVVDEEERAIAAEAGRIAGESREVGAEAERIGRHADEMAASARRFDERRLGALEGARVAVRPAADGADAPDVVAGGAFAALYRQDSLAQAVVLSEVLGPPKALRRSRVAGVRSLR